MDWLVTVVFIGMAGRREGDTRGEPTMTRRSRNVAGAPGRKSKIAGVGREVASYGWLKFEIIIEM
jgi:hypothetical protein